MAQSAPAPELCSFDPVLLPSSSSSLSLLSTLSAMVGRLSQLVWSSFCSKSTPQESVWGLAGTEAEEPNDAEELVSGGVAVD